jgi:hypothetical protein
LAASSGTIGGWTIDGTDGLKSSDGSTYIKTNGTCYFMPNGSGNGGVGVTKNSSGQIHLTLTSSCLFEIGSYYLNEERLKRILKHAGIIS